MKNLTLSGFLLLILFQIVSAQTITIAPPLDPNVCETSTFKLNISNTNSTPLLAGVLTIQLPCGMEYVVSSIKNATEKSIIDLSSPVFDISPIQSNKTLTLTLGIKLTCDAFQCIGEQKVFEITSIYQSGSISTSKKSLPFNVTTPEIAVIAVGAPYMEIEAFKSIDRKITIKNTRQGKISEFELENLYKGNISINSNQGDPISSGNGKYRIRLDSSDFVKIGNGDKYFDWNEIIIITENLIVNSCDFDKPSMLSEISTYWGCNNQLCNKTTTYATTKVKSITDPGEKLFLQAFPENPDCYSPGRATQRLEFFENQHRNEITNITINVTSKEKREILVGSVNAPSTFSISYLEKSTNECGQEIAKSFILKNNRLLSQPNQNPIVRQIIWESTYCEKTGCTINAENWNYWIEYTKECSKPNDTYFLVKKTSNGANPFFTSIKTSKLATLTNGDRDSIEVSLTSLKLKKTGNLTLKIVLPVSFDLTGNNFRLDNKLPNRVDITLNNNNNIITLEYQLPFSSNNVVLKFPFRVKCDLMAQDTSCLHVSYSLCPQCSPLGFSAILSIDANIIFPPCQEDGQIKACADSEKLYLTCVNRPICYDTISGYILYKSQIIRKTLGIADNDSNLYGDNSSIDPSNIRNNEFLIGDTFKLIHQGKIISSFPGTSFDECRLDLFFDEFKSSTSQNAAFMREILTRNEHGIKTINHIVKIFDKSTGEQYSIFGIQDITNDTVISMDLSVKRIRNLNSSMPSDFLYEDGDSIYIESTKYIDQKAFEEQIDKLKPNQYIRVNLIPNFGIKNADKSQPQTSINCNCDPILFSLAGYQYSYSNLISLVYKDSIYCDSTEFKDVFQTSMAVGHSGLFPKEIREEVAIRGLALTPSPYFDFTALRLSLLDTLFVLYPTILPNGNAYFDLTKSLPFGSPFALAKIKMELLKRIKIKCINKVSPRNIDFKFYVESKSKIAKLILPDTLTGVMNEFFILPRIKLSLKQEKLTTYDNRISTEFEIKQTNTDYQFPVNNVFVRVRSSSRINEYFLYNTIDGKELSQIRPGLYSLGKLKDKKIASIGFTAKGKTCGEEIIYFDYGFGCVPYLNESDEPCYFFTDSMIVNFQEAILDMNTDNNPTNITLCDTIENKVYIYNAGLGTAYDIQVDFALPPGVSIVPNTSRIIWPGTPNPIAIKNPKNLGNGSFEWNIKDEWNFHRIKGLSGSTDSPSNGFTIVYNTITTCDFISGSTIIYKIIGDQLCEEKTNAIAKVTNSFYLDDVVSPFTFEIVSDFTLKPACLLDSLVLNFSFKNEKNVTIKGNLDLPPGYTYIKTISNIGPLNPSITTNGLSYTFQPQSDSIKLKITLTKTNIAFCENEVIKFYASIPSTSICMGNACDVGVLTGQCIISIPSRTQNIVINDASLRVNPDNSAYLYLDLFNQGNDQITDLNIQIYRDVNGDGLFDSQDTLITNIPIAYTTPGNNQIKSLLTDLKISDLCHLLIVIDNLNQCICEPALTLISQPPIVTSVPITLCSGQETSLGINETIGNFQWDMSEGLSCTQCPSPSFLIENNSPNPRYLTRKLSYTSPSGCTIEYLYEITVNPLPTILSTNQKICQYDTVYVIATVAASYQWSGPNILTSNQILSATPLSSSIYFVTITDNNGCKGTAEIPVEVAPAPSVSVTYDTTYCYGILPILQVNTDSTHSVQWLNGSDRLSNATSKNPTVIVPGDFAYTLVVSNGSCSNTIQVPIIFKQGFDINGIKDTINVCKNEPSQVIMLDTGLIYTITPTNHITCLNPSCSSFIVTTNTEINIVIKAVDLKGCEVKKTVLVDVNSSFITEEQNFTICDGDSIIINGKAYSEPTIVCDTTKNGISCNRILCTVINILPPNIIQKNRLICIGDTTDFYGMLITDSGEYCHKIGGIGDDCDTTTCIRLDVLQLPDISTIPTRFVVESGQSIELQGLADMTSYLWAPATGLSCTTCQNPIASIDSSITYTLIVTDANGCINRTRINIDVEISCISKIDRLPNAFTPNGDRNNDIYTIPNISSCGPMEFVVYNRWGNIVYESKDWDNAWDGSSKSGQRLPQGTYYVAIHFINLSIIKTTMVDLRIE